MWSTLCGLLLLAVVASGQMPLQVNRLRGGIRYPELARQARIEGTVEVRCPLRSDGAVQACSLLKGHPLLAAPALENMKGWIFESPVGVLPAEVHLTYQFQLAGEATRGPAQTEFWFEAPSRILVVAQPTCADHGWCNEDERRQGRKTRKPSKPAIGVY